MINVVAEAGECNRQAAKGTARDEFFSVVLTDGGRLNTTLDFSKRGIAQNVVSSRKGRFPEHGSASGQCTYAGMAAQTLEGAVPLFAAMPGAGANFGSVKGPTRKGKQQVSHITMLVVDQGENLQLKKFYEREFGGSFERDDLRYLDYTKFLDAPLPDPGFSTQRFVRYAWDDFGAEFLRLPSALEVVRKNRTGGFESPIAFSDGGDSGHLYVARKAVVASVQVRGPGTLVPLKPDAARDLGFFVTTAGKTLLLERLAGASAFTVPTTLPRRFVTQMQFDPSYDIVPGDPGQPLSGNLIEQVTPKCFW